MKGTQIIIGRDERQKAFFTGLSTFIDLINQQLSKEYSPEPLGKHIKVLGGYAFKSSEYKSVGIPVIRISDFQDEKIDLSNVQYYKESNEYDKYQLFEGDIIIALTGGTIGKLGIVQGGLGKLYLNQRVGKFLVLHPKEFYDQYIYWLARGIQEKVKSFGYGGAQPNISGSQIEEILFPVPDKKIQERIAEFLKDLRDNQLKDKEYFHKETEKRIVSILKVIEGILTSQNLQGKNISYITKLRQSILQSAVQGKLVKQNPKDEPASILLKKIKTEKDKLIKEGKIRKDKPLVPISEEEKLYNLPRGWEWCRLGEICLINPRNDLDNNLEVSFIPMNLIEDGFSNKHLQEIRRWSEIKSGFTHFAEGDVVFAKITPCFQNRKSAILKNLKNKYGAGTTELYVLRSYGKTVLPEIFLYLVKTDDFITKGVLSYTGTAGQQRVKREFFENLIIGLPPLPEQARIVEKVDKLMAYCDELERQVKENQENSEKLMRAVLKESFEGK